MKILIIPNALKGSLSASAFCKYAKISLKGKDTVVCIPVSDGGDGILDVFASAFPGAKEYKITVINAVYKKRKAPYLLLPDGKTCVIETAKICGLGNLEKTELNPMQATSYGIGQMILAAAKKGAANFYVGLGGVACNDAGAGMAQALGFSLINKNGKEIKGGVRALLDLHKILLAPKAIAELKFTSLSDVKNPLLGPMGSAKVYGPQKGALPGQVKVMEKALTNFAKVAKKDLKKNVNKLRCGAAGAIGAGMYGFLNASLQDGAPFILNKLKARQAIKKCDVVITAEGKLDEQTFYGKAPQAVCKLALKYKKPVIFVCGVNALKDNRILRKHGVQKILQLSDYAKSAKDSMQNAPKHIEAALKTIDLQTFKKPA